MDESHAVRAQFVRDLPEIGFDNVSLDMDERIETEHEIDAAVRDLR